MAPTLAVNATASSVAEGGVGVTLMLGHTSQFALAYRLAKQIPMPAKRATLVSASAPCEVLVRAEPPPGTRTGHRRRHVA